MHKHSSLTLLYAHLRWADDAARDALQRMPESAPEYQRALATYAHVAAAEHIWLARLEGRAPSYAVWPTLSLTEASRLAADSATGLAAFVARCGADDLASTITYRTSAGHEMRSSVQDILLHVALHGSYHRGQLASLVRAAGAAPAATDFIVYARERASPTAPSAAPASDPTGSDRDRG